jgi:hypothetical protein
VSLSLPKPGPAYDANNEAQARAAIEQSDAGNQKKTRDYVIHKNRLILVSPNGTHWSGTIGNSGILTWTAL